MAGWSGKMRQGRLGRKENVNCVILRFWSRSVHIFFSDPDSPISDLISTTIRISRMIPTPYLYPYMGFGIHQPCGIAYGGDILEFESQKRSVIFSSELNSYLQSRCLICYLAPFSHVQHGQIQKRFQTNTDIDIIHESWASPAESSCICWGCENLELLVGVQTQACEVAIIHYVQNDTL